MKFFILLLGIALFSLNTLAVDWDTEEQKSKAAEFVKQSIIHVAGTEGQLSDYCSFVNSSVDMDSVASRVASVKWRRATPEQKGIFSQAYSSVLSNVFVEKFAETLSHIADMIIPLDLVKARRRPENSYNVTVEFPDTLPLQFVVQDKAADGNYKIADLIVQDLGIVGYYKILYRRFLSRMKEGTQTRHDMDDLIRYIMTDKDPDTNTIRPLGQCD